MLPPKKRVVNLWWFVALGARRNFHLFPASKTMKKWLTQHRDIAVPAIVVLLATLILANLVRYRFLTASALAANKEALSALSSAVTIVALSVGSVFSVLSIFSRQDLLQSCRAQN